MTQPNVLSVLVAVTALTVGAMFGAKPAGAAPPSVVHADIDYDASGYVTPAGMVPPSMYFGGVMPVGYFGADCDSCGASGGYGCDAGCDSCGGGGCLGGCLGGGGVLGKIASGGGLKPLCFFCRGSGCSACQIFGGGQFLAALHALKPYSEAGVCALRWYDLSAEVLLLSHSSGGLSGPITSQDRAGDIVLFLGDADSGSELEAGARLSGSLIFGPGGSLEATYMGGHEWRSAAAAFSDTPTLFSFVSDFGTNPDFGFDDTDTSFSQSISNRSRFHSVELNYRRRTMGPYCKFQGSWLAGLRYIRFDNSLQYATDGIDDEFFASTDKIKNNLLGGQLGFDLWWNMHPGIHFGMGMKGAWVQNDAKRRTVMSANSIGAGAVPGTVVLDDVQRRGTVVGDFEAKILYRLTYHWTFRTAYYATAIDKIGFGTVDRDTFRSFITGAPIPEPRRQTNSLTVQGFSFGAEYLW